MLAHDALHDHQPEAVPAGLGRVVGLEELREILRPDAHAGVAKHEVDRVVIGARLDLELSARAHRLHRIGDEIEEHLFQLVAVGQNRRQLGLGLGLDGDAAVFQLAGLEAQHLVEHVDDAGLGEVGRPRPDGLEKVGDDAVETLDLLLADRDGPGERLRVARGLQFFQLPRDELQVDGERVEWVAQFVRHPGGEQEDRRGLLILDQPLGRLLLPGDVGEDDGEPARLLADALGLERHHVEPDGARLRIAQLDLARHDRHGNVVGQRGFERWVQPGHEPPERGAGQLALAQTDEAGGRLVGVLDRPVGADDEDALVDGVEDRLEQAALAGEALHEIGEVDRVQRVEPSEHAVEGTMFPAGHDGNR